MFNGEGDEHDVGLERTLAHVDIVFSTVSRRIYWSMTMMVRPTEAMLLMSSLENRQTMVRLSGKVESPQS